MGAPAAVAAGPPLVKETWAADVKAGSAVVKGTVNPNGLATTVRVEYIGETAYQANLAASPPRDGFTGAIAVPTAGTAIGSGSTDQAFSLTLSGLKSSSVYHYRLVATNSNPASPGVGPTRTFLTDETGAVFSLPDSRGWEMVSPVEKNGGTIGAPESKNGGLRASFDVLPDAPVPSS